MALINNNIVIVNVINNLVLLGYIKYKISYHLVNASRAVTFSGNNLGCHHAMFILYQQARLFILVSITSLSSRFHPLLPKLAIFELKIFLVALL